MGQEYLSPAPPKKLTPIRVRGKRKLRPQQAASSSSSQEHRSDSEKSAVGPQLLPEPRCILRQKRRRELSPTANRSWSRSPAPRRMRTQKYTPFDQYFPHEIIERIFFYSENLNLALASPRLSLMLSSRHTLRDLVLQAFAPCWDAAQNLCSSTKNPTRKETTASEISAQAALKSKILNCPWARMDLMLDAQQVWLRKNRARGKSYVHTFRPCLERSVEATAPKFVLNMQDLETLVKSHSLDHISSIDSLAFCTIECQAEQAAAPPGNGGKEMSEKNTAHTRITCTERPHETSTHVCFALDQYLAMESVFHKHSTLREESHGRSRGSCEGVRIPEWLLVAGGPYPPGRSRNKKRRKAVRDRLRDAMDMLTWLIHEGAQLHPMDSWETTWEGFQQLLQVDVRPHEWDTYEEGEPVVSMHHSYTGNGQKPPSDRPARLQYTVDALVAALLCSFSRLGVFGKWPCDIRTLAWKKVIDYAERENGALQHTQTYSVLQRIISPLNDLDEELYRGMANATRPTFN
ncbi:hypothetical protein SEPCBS119000_004760 [Sporothrix epigloea]|uniref:F-box domain-containing protein n=1 Tax=Sporothrix epigloea TaxID=1892477 RepID=A0ABP0DWT0_9PEZI